MIQPEHGSRDTSQVELQTVRVPCLECPYWARGFRGSGVGLLITDPCLTTMSAEGPSVMPPVAGASAPPVAPA
jgi:hypothetical protein